MLQNWEAVRDALVPADSPQGKALGTTLTHTLDEVRRAWIATTAADWLAFGMTWVQDDEPVDFVNGFIETYRDARAAKGSSQALVSISDRKMAPLMQKLATNALYFEKKAPWAELYKKLDVSSRSQLSRLPCGDLGSR